MSSAETTPADPWGRGAAPIVAIVGRPNVGKSTLFNRLVGRRQSIVHDTPGVTRDRVTGSLELDRGPAVLIDTGGLAPGSEPLGLDRQVLLAVEESDLLVLVVDGREGLTGADEEVWQQLRAAGKPAILAVNKGDTKTAQQGFSEFYALGIEALALISAEHGTGIGELLEHIEARAVAIAEQRTNAEAVGEVVARLAVVGRPNVGKSSIVNRLLGRERALVSDVAGTTRDPTDSVLETSEGSLLLIDTAGIRRRSQVSGVPEEIAVMMARRQIERADVAALVIDAAAGVTAGDLAIGGSIWELGRAALVLINKWDLLDPEKREHLEKGWTRLEETLRSPPRVNVSALSARGMDKVAPAVHQALPRFRFEVETSELNRVLGRAVERHAAPAKNGRPWRLLYSTQVATAPPTFMLFANRTLLRQDPYRRYLENVLRRSFDLRGVPIRLVIRKRRRAEV